MRCEVLIDWLTFSVKSDKPDDVIRDYLGMDSDLFQDPGYSINGYQRCKAFNNILVCYEGRENDFFHDMGVCVSMSGQGCRTFETYSRLGATGDKEAGSASFMALFQKLDSTDEAHVTRLDVACDEKDGSLDMKTMIDKIENGEVNSRTKRRTVEIEMNGRKQAGKTIYIGSKSSEFRTRIYDKAQEQGVSGHWIRVELVLKGKNGDNFIYNLVQGQEIGQLAAQVINDKFSFIEDDDSNITRCSVSDWWSAFVEEVEKVHLVARCTIQHSVLHISEWVQNQVGPSLYILAETVGFSKVYEMAMRAKDRINRKQEALIADWNSIQMASKALAAVPG